jgi:uncharacterized OsmC-like protein
MITTKSLPDKYKTSFSDGTYEAVTDAPTSMGGKGEGFKPPVLLEASLATCINTVIRVAADARNIPLEGVEVSVTMKESNEETVFEYTVELAGDLTAEQRESVLRAIPGCPVKKALSKPIVFKAAE